LAIPQAITVRAPAEAADAAAFKQVT